MNVLKKKGLELLAKAAKAAAYEIPTDVEEYCLGWWYDPEKPECLKQKPINVQEAE